MATQIEKNTEKLIQRKLDILFAKQQQLNNNAGGQQQQQQYAMGGPIGNIFNASINAIPKIKGKRDKYYKENLGNQQANVDMMNAYHTMDYSKEPLWFPIVGHTPGGWKKTAENNKQVQTGFEQQFIDTYGRKPTGKDMFMMNQRATELLPKQAQGGYLPQYHDGGGVPHSHNTSISGDYGYGFDPWRQTGYNASLSPIGLDPRNTRGFVEHWGQPYSGPVNTRIKSPTMEVIHNPGETGIVGNRTTSQPIQQQQIGLTNRPYQSEPLPQQLPYPVDGSVIKGGAMVGSKQLPQPWEMVDMQSLAYQAPDDGKGYFKEEGQAPWAKDVIKATEYPTLDFSKNSFGIKGSGNASLPDGSGGPGPNWGKVGTMAGQIAPMIYNMAMGLKKPDKVRPNYNPYEGQIRSLMANRRFNIDPLLTANRTANAVANRNVRNTGNSRGEMMGNYGANQNYRMQADADAWAQKNNMDNRYMGQQAEMDAQLGWQRAGMDWNTQMENAGNKAATQQFMSQGFNELGKFAQTQQLMNNQMKNSQYLGGIYQDIHGGLGNFLLESQKAANAFKMKNNGQ